jgi:hypothetical protein
MGGVLADGSEAIWRQRSDGKKKIARQCIGVSRTSENEMILHELRVGGVR